MARPALIEIDGAQGEGGGQVLRTALSLSALTGQPVRLYNIRAARRNPGLAPQHLTAVRALEQICAAQVRGAVLRSRDLTFTPGTPPRAGNYTFDVAQAASRGSAGAVSLIMQAVLLPLALTTGESHLTLLGGTHVPWSPPFHYLTQIYLPMLARMGVEAVAELDAWGFYPAGGGRVTARIRGRPGALRPLALTDRGPLERVWGTAVAANLPASIAQRISGRARNVLAAAGLRAEITPARERSAGPGAGVFLFARYAHSVAGFSALGEKGKPSEQVADEACQALLRHHASALAADLHLADQLLLPAALAGGTSEYTTCRVSQHLLTNAAIIRHLLPVEIRIQGAEGEPGRVVVAGSSVV